MKSAWRMWCIILLAGCESQGASVTLVDASADGPVTDTPATTNAAVLRSDLPGLGLWLAPGLGFIADGSRADEWIDQTVHKHRLYSDVPEFSPQIVKDVHGEGLHFDGKGRLALANEPPPDAKAAMALNADDFFVAVVAKPEAWPHDGQILWAMGHHFSELQLDLATPLVPASMTVGTELKAVLSADHAPVELRSQGVMVGEVHLYVVRVAGPTAEMRIDGKVVASAQRKTSAETGAFESLPFRPLHIGNWDYDLTGFRGTIYEVVLIKGQDPVQKSADVERFLLEKYRP